MQGEGPFVLNNEVEVPCSKYYSSQIWDIEFTFSLPHLSTVSYLLTITMMKSINKSKDGHTCNTGYNSGLPISKG